MLQVFDNVLMILLSLSISIWSSPLIIIFLAETLELERSDNLDSANNLKDENLSFPITSSSIDIFDLVNSILRADKIRLLKVLISES